jgi:hypothetical protein
MRISKIGIKKLSLAVGVLTLTACTSNSYKHSNFAVEERVYKEPARHRWTESYDKFSVVKNGIAKGLGLRNEQSFRATSTKVIVDNEEVNVHLEKKPYEEMKIYITPVKVNYGSGIYIADDSLYHKVTSKIMKLIEESRYNSQLSKIKVDITGYADAKKYSTDAKLKSLFDGWQTYDLSDAGIEMYNAETEQRVKGRYRVNMPMTNTILAQLRAIDAYFKVVRTFDTEFKYMIDYSLRFKVYKKDIGSQYRGIKISISTNK